MNSVGDFWTGKIQELFFSQRRITSLGLNLWFDSTDILNDDFRSTLKASLAHLENKSTYGRDMDNSNGESTLKFEESKELLR